MEAQIQAVPKPKLLFVDDEQRVLNSMRIMFRRKFELYLASHGAEALDIVKSEDIDVIIADHRMPKMTGVEVLSAVRSLSPRTVRILLTGYADLDAVEGSINESEVFRFLTKPCPPQQLRDTIELAARVAQEAPAVAGPREHGESDDPDVLEPERLEIILQADTAHEMSDTAPEPEEQAALAEPRAAPPPPADTAEPEPVNSGTQRLAQPNLPDSAQTQTQAPAPAPRPPAKRRLATGMGVIVFTAEDEVVQTVQQAVRGRLPVYQATNVVQVVKILKEKRPGVLMTDISEDRATIQSMTAQLKEHLPELVTIAISQHRDVLDMVWLINHGQIFRFLRKPISTGRCAVSLQAALQHHRTLLKNPELVQRHEVTASRDASMVSGVLDKIKSVRRLWASA